MKNDFTIKEFAELLGVTMPTIWRMINDNELHAYKVRRAVRIPNSEYQRLISDNRIQAKAVT